MRIPCPYCGDRSNDEFNVLGDADALMNRPSDPSLSAFDVYLHARANPAGHHRELWYHHGGCRRWLVVTRDTTSHAVLDVALASKFQGQP
ncbi:MAG: sarcosine oxidase subunit delta [Hyphomicrobiaceae bacterium]